MARKQIQFLAGAIAPAPRSLWSSAQEKLHEAGVAIEQMQQAHDRIQFEAGWSRFVDSIEEFWARFFDEGKSTFSNFQPWAGALDARRKSDDLLGYLCQARHQSQHGRIAISWTEPRLQIAPNFSGHIRGLKFFADGTFEFDASPLHHSIPEATVVFDPGAAELPIIENKRHKQKFNPPKSFEGQSLDACTPVAASLAALGFYRRALSLAFEEFT
ncbi:hypothetical protein [Roseateles oligotrophus]|uniref:Uncharacterized protein n=1 Tax=Roseateles oligotrophus TaxID=1769250 RepID=A0ABT2Y9S4_9BURK|nr:hypothetical protein [Roseateles oligotrophus]MCV2367023.1 hypothetical protein [Roseateles oligotrophus]